jgi:dTDP-L-rhamnose 4-epimerase
MIAVISGGLGFIGTKLTQAIVAQGGTVRILDNLHPQIHASDAARLRLAPIAEIAIGDVADAAAWRSVLRDDATHVFHLAAETGTGQSFDVVSRYNEVNVVGTARLADALAASPSVRTVFLPSSRAVYGEGAYRCDEHGAVLPQRRSRAALEAGDFFVRCPICGRPAVPIATGEDVEPRPASIYAATKLMQEHLLRLSCEARGVELRVARYQNVYGAGQALNNPYTGVLAIFARQIAAGATLNIYEDGDIVRDFIHVDDVVRATLAIAASETDPGVINIGSGTPTSILDVVATFERAFARPVPYRISGDFRFGDIRHALANTGRMRALVPALRLRPFDQGIAELTQWVAAETTCRD